MQKIKTLIKKNKKLIELYNYFFIRPIKNLNNKNHVKKALLSYSVYPFLKKNRAMIHPNYVESYTLNKVLDELEYQVDVYNNIYTGKIKYENYALIIGEGIPISNYFLLKNKKALKTIYYATGSHPIFNNLESNKVLFRFYNKFERWLQNSSRIVDEKWGIGASLSDNLIIIGNDVTKKSFEKYSNTTSLHMINPPFYKRVTNIDLNKKKQNKFLWFGSYGLIHKGLDTVIEAFLERPELELNICGYLDGESEFIDCYKKELSKSSNIKLHGFINIESEDFKKIMEECSFVILTSVAEGLATAVITAMGNGGLIPIVTKETGIDISLGIEVLKNDKKELLKALEFSQNYSKEEITEKSLYLMEKINCEFSEEKFEENLRKILIEIEEN